MSGVGALFRLKEVPQLGDQLDTAPLSRSTEPQLALEQSDASEQLRQR